MPKAAHAPSEEKQVSKAAFLKSLDKQKSVAAAAAKAERKTGFASDLEILAKLGIEPNMSKTFNAMVSKIAFSFAKDDANRPAFRFNYAIVSDNKKENGTIVGNYYILEEGKYTSGSQKGEVFRSLEDSQAQVFGEFQGLGEDTAAWALDPRVNPLHHCVTAAEDHTKAKTPVTVVIKHWAKGDKSGMNVLLKGPMADADNSDLELNEETVEPLDEEFNAEEWIGLVVEFKNLQDETIKGKIDSYNEDTDTFNITDENGEIWDNEDPANQFAIAAADVVYIDDQTWEDAE